MSRSDVMLRERRCVLSFVFCFFVPFLEEIEMSL